MCDEPQSPAREYYDHPDWQDGDFTLISSDGWRFRISSEVLFAASEVLSDAPAMGAPELQFPDADFEHKAVIEQFLSLATTGSLHRSKATPGDVASTMDELKVCMNLIQFVNKYDCAPTLEAFRAAMAKGEFWGWEVFAIGVMLEDDELCAAGLEVKSPPPSMNMQTVGPRYRYALRCFERQVADWFEITPMPLADFFTNALWDYDNPTPHAAWRRGDTTLVSSDLWEFRVPSYALQAAGYRSNTRWIERLDWPQVPPLIRFHDHDLETKAVLELFVDLAVNGKPSPLDKPWHMCGSLPDPELVTYLRTIKFMRKHRCPRALAAFGAHVIRLMTLGVLTPPVAFGLGVLADNRDVCAASLATYDPDDPAQGVFRGREALPSFVGRWVRHADIDLLKALDHVERFLKGPGQSHEAYLAYLASRKRRPVLLNVHSASGEFLLRRPASSESLLDEPREPRGPEFSDYGDVEDISDPGTPQPFNRHLARRFLSSVYKSEQIREEHSLEPNYQWYLSEVLESQ